MSTTPEAPTIPALSSSARRLAALLQRGFVLYYGWHNSGWFAAYTPENEDGEYESRTVRREDAQALINAGVVVKARYANNHRDTYRLTELGRRITPPPWRPTKAQAAVLARMREGDTVEAMGRSYFFVEGMRLTDTVPRVLFLSLIDQRVVERTDHTDPLQHARWAATPVRSLHIGGVPVLPAQEGHQFLCDQIAAVAPLQGRLVRADAPGAYSGSLIVGSEPAEAARQIADRLRTAWPDWDWSALRVEVGDV